MLPGRAAWFQTASRRDRLVDSRSLEAGRFSLTGAHSVRILCSRDVTHWPTAEDGSSMTQDRGMDSRKAARAPFPPRSRRRWALAGGFAAAWLVLYLVAGS